MSPRRLIKALCVAGLATGLSGFAMQRLPAQYNTEHYVNDDPAWTLLNSAEVDANSTTGVYHARFPKDLKALEGKSFIISGFMMPLEAWPETQHFALMRRNSACPFCPPNAPTEAIDVQLTSKIKYTGDEISVTGRLRLIESSANGLFYKLENATVGRRS